MLWSNKKIIKINSNPRTKVKKEEDRNINYNEGIFYETFMGKNIFQALHLMHIIKLNIKKKTQIIIKIKNQQKFK